MTTTTENPMIEVAPISTKSANEYSDKALQLHERVKNLTITGQADYESAAAVLRSVKDMAKSLEEARKRITTPLDNAKKAVMDLFRPPTLVLEIAEKKIKETMIAYTNEQERIRFEREEKLRKQAENEETKKRAALEEKARKAREAGNEEKADQLEQKAAEVHVQAPVLASTVQKVDGISMKQNWKARVIDANKVPREYLVVDEQKLNQMAKATKGSLSIAGVEFYAEDVLASR